MASGPLTPPDVPSLPRAVLEEHILARMLCRPGDLPASMASLPLTTFTADARYDIYAAIITVASTGQRWNLEHVAAELGRRMDWVPEWALPRHGGQGTPWPQAYLRRLANTEPLSYAVPRLLADDTQARLESAAPEAGAQRLGRGGKTYLGDAGKRPVARAHRRRSAGCDPAGLAPVDRARARRPGATDVSTRSVQSSIEEGNQHELARRISAPTARSGEEQVGRNAGPCRRTGDVRRIRTSARRRRRTRPARRS